MNFYFYISQIVNKINANIKNVNYFHIFNFLKFEPSIQAPISDTIFVVSESVNSKMF
jgi:hypothetical protein